jgi:hypothetical protein
MKENNQRPKGELITIKRGGGRGAHLVQIGKNRRRRNDDELGAKLTNRSDGAYHGSRVWKRYAGPQHLKVSSSSTTTLMAGAACEREKGGERGSDALESVGKGNLERSSTQKFEGNEDLMPWNSQAMETSRDLVHSEGMRI